jgi:hypothetical protein
MFLGIPAQIKEIIGIDNQIAMVDLSGVSRAVNIAIPVFFLSWVLRSNNNKIGIRLQSVKVNPACMNN